MSTISAVYSAPVDDNAVVTMQGIRFFDGQSVELDTEEHAALIGKLRTNPHFVVFADEAVDPTKLEAVHKGGGKWIITRGGDKANPVKSDLDKTDAAAFNALSDEDKAAYVAD